MDEQIKLFLKFLQNDKKLSDNTLQSYKRDISQFETYVEENQIEKELNQNRKDGFLGKKKFIDETNDFVNEQQKLVVKKAKYAYELKLNDKNK